MKRAGATTAGGGGSVLKRIVAAPLWALRRARDLYVTGMTRCAGAVGPAGVVGYPGDFNMGVPRSHSFRSASRSSSAGEDDLRELIRAASQGAMGSLNLGGGGGAVRRSQSVGMGRIDEDRPCDFAGLDGGALAGPLYPRSRSCAVVAKSKVGPLL
ncbi:hypothetical protein Taro_052520 [Colocasia esculenta]|uniref:Uncharacterized protein n=1 Tax=Colocasia esculenta TaxID=4460 RepID=A0A843XJZ4_COLES|nr:hypothetical protein [Colocasia esculenta]